MKKITTLITTFVLSLGIFAQNDVSVEASFKGLTNCVDIEIMAMKIIPGFYKKNQFDSIALTLDYVTLTCMETEALRITRFLMEMETRSFTDSSMTSRDIYLLKKEAKNISNGHLYDFYHFMLLPQFAGSVYASDIRNPFNRIEIEQRMIDMIREWRMKLVRRGDLSTLEKSVLHHLRGAPDAHRVGKNLFLEVNRSKYKGSRVRKTYDKYHDNFVMSRAVHFGIAYSHHIPGGDAGTVYGQLPGLHVAVGYNFTRRNRVDMYLGGRWGSASNAYRVQRPDTTFFSRKASSLIGGFDFTRTIWRPSRRFDLSVTAGIGWEERFFFTELDEDGEVDNEPNDIINAKMGPTSGSRTYGLAGLEFKYFVGSGLAINISPRYMFSGNFDRYIATPVNGNTLVLNIGLSVFGGGHPSRRNVKFWSLSNN